MAHGTHVILKAFAPSRKSYDASVLTYQNVRSNIDHYAFSAFLKKNGMKLLTRKKALSLNQLVHEFHVASILSASYRLQKSFTPVDKYVWSKVFTQASVRLFGRPSKREISRLASAELQALGSIATGTQQKEFIEPVLATYRSLIDDKAKPVTPLGQTYSQLLCSIQTYFESEFQDVFACFESYPTTHQFAPKDIVNVFSDALRLLAQRDVSWADWSVEMDESAHLSVNVHHKSIVVGKYRAAINRCHIKGLFAHEVLVHAQRALNGAKISKELATGTTDYLVAEEGLGVLVEAAMNGEIPEKIKDRYIDVALALGTRWRRPLTREELYNICYRRFAMRSIARDGGTDLDGLEKTTWEHVNRIYRGSLGNQYIGVFTKDIAYYKGFMKLAKHFEKARKKGMIDSQIRFALQGKFDPTV